MLGAAIALYVSRPVAAFAGIWNRLAFDAKDVEEAVKAIGAAGALPSRDILIQAPEIAENGAQVPVEIESRLPGTQSIYILVDKNPQPLVGNFEFRNAALPFISTRIKMGETSDLRVVVLAGGTYYFATREIKVTIGGCGT
jgi:sulfur-oxidizing protein SoxY